MSFHQRYEFLAMERPLGAEDLAVVRQISSHATVTPTRFAVSYDWGDLRGSADEMLLRWYDAHLYRSSNSARLVVKVPVGVLDADTQDLFAAGELQSFDAHGQHVLVSWHLEDDNSRGWINDEDVGTEFDGLAIIRSALVGGDLRPLYVGWLAGIDELGDEDQEPPVPARLGAADDPSTALAEFLGVDGGLLAAAAEASASTDKKQQIAQVRAWLASVPPAEKDSALASWLGFGDRDPQDRLRRQLSVWRQAQSAAPQLAPRRTVAELRARAEILAAQHKKAEAERKLRERAIHLDDVTARSAAIWAAVAQLSQGRSQSMPQQVVDRLRDLRDAADAKGQRRAFDAKLAAFAGTISPARVLHQRLKQAGLVG